MMVITQLTNIVFVFPTMKVNRDCHLCAYQNTFSYVQSFENNEVKEMMT